MRIFSNQYMSWGSGTGLIEQQFYEEQWIEKEFGVLLGRGVPRCTKKRIFHLCARLHFNFTFWFLENTVHKKT